jgi:hypothetical protein
LTPANITSNVSQDAMSVEFWIKPVDDTFYVGDKKIIFTLKDNVEALNTIREEKNLEDYTLDLDKVEEETVELREWMKIYIE